MNDPLLHNYEIANKELSNFRIILCWALNLPPGLTLKTVISVIFTPAQCGACSNCSIGCKFEIYWLKSVLKSFKALHRSSTTLTSMPDFAAVMIVSKYFQNAINTFNNWEMWTLSPSFQIPLPPLPVFPSACVMKFPTSGGNHSGSLNVMEKKESGRQQITKRFPLQGWVTGRMLNGDTESYANYHNFWIQLCEKMRRESSKRFLKGTRLESFLPILHMT